MARPEPRRQAAAVPYRYRRGRLEILLVTTRSRARWIVPKGFVDGGEAARESAAREAREEAGARGRVRPGAIARYRDDRRAGPRVVEVFLLRVTRLRARWDEDDEREREWVRYDRAIRRVRHPGMREALRAVARELSPGDVEAA